MKLENYGDGPGMGGPGLPPQAGGQDKYGMLGLLNVIRMNNENLTLLALGCDLTRLGLDLNASGDIYDTFNSPWDRGLQRKNEEYRSRVCLRVYVCVCFCVCVCVCLCVQHCVCIYTYMCVVVYECGFIHMYRYTYMNIYIYAHIYIYIYI